MRFLIMGVSNLSELSVVGWLFFKYNMTEDGI